MFHLRTVSVSGVLPFPSPPLPSGPRASPSSLPWCQCCWSCLSSPSCDTKLSSTGELRRFCSKCLWLSYCLQHVWRLSLAFQVLYFEVSGSLWIVVKDVKILVVYDVEWEMAMDSMKGKCASSCVDLGYTNQFCFPDLEPVCCSMFSSNCCFLIYIHIWCVYPELRISV